MGRPRVVINSAWADNIRTICKEQGITQTQLAKAISITQQTLSKIVQGKASLTAQNAEAIIKLFPEYRFQWLMGYDQYKTTEDYKMNVFLDRAFAQMDEDKAIMPLLSVLGYEEIRKERSAIDRSILVTIKKPDGESIQISNHALDKARRDIAWYSKVRMQRLFEEERGDIDG